MSIDIKSHKKKISSQKPSFNLVPFIDILFTIMIFLVITSSFSSTDVTQDGAASGKPNVTDTSGSAEYYVVPVANLNKVIVDGEDMSSHIKNNAIAIKANVIDQGEISIKPGKMIIKAPPGVSPQDAVKTPQ